MAGMNRNSGLNVNDTLHIQQSIADILTTPIGSRVMRRTYGSLLPELIDHPLIGAMLLRAKAASADAIIRWENRIKLKNISFMVDSDSQLIIDVEYSISNSQNYSLSVPLGLKGVLA
jgi:uncharacterized protein